MRFFSVNAPVDRAIIWPAPRCSVFGAVRGLQDDPTQGELVANRSEPRPPTAIRPPLGVAAAIETDADPGSTWRTSGEARAFRGDQRRLAFAAPHAHPPGPVSKFTDQGSRMARARTGWCRAGGGPGRAVGLQTSRSGEVGLCCSCSRGRCAAPVCTGEGEADDL